MKSTTIVVIIALIVILIAGYFAFKPQATNTNTNNNNGAPNAIKINISNLAFEPTSLTAQLGDVVTWTNNDSVAHQIVSNNGAFSSPTLNQGESFSLDITSELQGNQSYYCSIHPSMIGSITVTP